MARMLIIGCGYAGTRVAALHLAAGDDVIVTTRNAACALERVHHLQLDIDTLHSSLPSVNRVYYTVPPPATGTTDSRLANLLDHLPTPKEFVYFSTTGVYGDQEGTFVSELTPVAPGTDRARRRVDAEQHIRQWCTDRSCSAAILRVPGIYGPGRLPLARLVAGEPVPEGGETGPGNRIHVDDLAAAAVAIANSGRGGNWNISDGNPLSTADFMDIVAAAAGLPLPRRVPLASPEISDGIRSFLRESRRIDNRKLLDLEGFELRYPDPADGVRESITK